MSKVCLVLEGGAMRGMFTAGVLDVLLDNNIQFDCIIGVSAGALFGVNYYSNQKGRVIRYSKRFCKDLRYISIMSLLLTGNIVNKNFAYYKMSMKLDKFDDNAFKNCNHDFYAVVTNISTGLPEYIKISSCYEQMEVLRATSAMPLVTKPVKLNNNYYLDGAVSDSIPVLKAKEMGYDKVVVILTRPITYRKDELSKNEIKRVSKKYHSYPNLVSSIINRPKKYNTLVERIIDMENKKDIFVIRPSEPINIKVIERNKKNLEKIYNLGINDSKNSINMLKEYLKN